MGCWRLLQAVGRNPDAGQQGEGYDQWAGAKDFDQELHGSVLSGVSWDLLDQPVGVSRGAKGEGHTCGESKNEHCSCAVDFTVAAVMVCRFPQKSELPTITAFAAAGGIRYFRPRSFEI